MTKFKYEELQKRIKKEFKRIIKLFRYIKRVFHFDEIVKNQKDFRKKRTIQTDVIFIIVFWAFILRIESFNKLEEKIKAGYFKPLFKRSVKIPSIDTIQRTPQEWDLQELQKSFESILETLYKNKVFINGTIGVYTVCGIDGTEVISSTDKKCNTCVKMKSKNGNRKYVHKACVVMTIGNLTNYVIKKYMLKPSKDNEKDKNIDNQEKELEKSEGEVTSLKAIVVDLPKWIDVVVGDSAYFNAPSIKAIKSASKEAVIRLEDKRRKVYKNIDNYQTNNKADGQFKHEEVSKKIEISYWAENTHLQDTTVEANSEEKYIEIKMFKFVEVINITVKDSDKLKFREIYVCTTDKTMSAKTVWEMIHKRWDLENTCFNQLKTFCSMEHCFVHNDTAIEAILDIMFMAFNIMRSFFFRRLKAFKEKFEKGKDTISGQIDSISDDLIAISKLLVPQDLIAYTLNHT